MTILSKACKPDNFYLYNSPKLCHKLCDEMGHPIDNLMESQWKLRQHDQNFPMGGKPLNKY